MDLRLIERIDSRPMGRHQPSTAYGRWQTAELARLGKSAADMSRKTGIGEPLLSKWKLGRETPGENRRQVIADYFGVDPTTVPINPDASSVIAAQNLSGVTGKRAPDEVQPSPAAPPLTPPLRTTGGEQLEGPMYERATKVFYLMCGLDRWRQDRIYSVVLVEIGKLAHDHAPPQPAAGRSDRRSRKK